MRMVFGLAGLLVTLGVIVFIMHYVELPDIQAAHQAQEHADQVINQISGRDATGTRIENTYSLYADNRDDGKLQDFQVTQLAPGSPMETFFGLKVNDVIVAAWDGHGVRTDMNGATDEEMAKDAVREAYTTGGKLVVQRGDEQLTLPIQPTQPNPPPQARQQTPAQQQQPNADGGESGTLDTIRQRFHQTTGMN